MRKPKHDFVVTTYYTREEGQSKVDAIGGDYAWIEIRDTKGALIAEFGDDYHDKGDDKLEGFLYGWAAATGRMPVVKRKDEATYECLSSSDEVSLVRQLRDAANAAGAA